MALSKDSKRRVLKRNALAIKHAKAIDGRVAAYRIEGDQGEGTVERGLELRVQPSGRATWFFTYATGSKSARKVERMILGHRDCLDLSGACDKAAKLRVALIDGHNPAAERKERRMAAQRPPAKTYTFKDLAIDWTNQHDRPKNTERTVYNNGRMLDKDILPAIGHMPADAITKRDVIALLNAVVARGIERDQERGIPADAAKGFKARPNQVLHLVRSIFRWGVREELVKSEPSQGVTPRVRQESRDRVLTDAEIRTIWARLSETDMPRTHVMAIKLSLITAQRIGECSCVAKSELDLTPGRAVWTIPSSRTKNSEPHRVPLSPMAVALIREAWAASGDSPHLFPARGGKKPIPPHAAPKWLYEVRDQTGVDDWTIHDCRRTAATNMAMLRVEKHVVSLILNHVSETGGRAGGITAIYNRYSYDREKRQALELWANRLEAILEGREPADDNVIPFQPAAVVV